MAPLVQPGQTLLFLGDHTSPDDLGYVAIIRDVLSRFFANLNLRLLSAGSPNQTAAAIASQALTDIVTSSKPDWLIIGIGLTDALREPAAAVALRSQANRQSRSEQDEAEATFGPELQLRRENLGPVSDVGRDPEPKALNVDRFEQQMAGALKLFASVGINVAVLTTVVTGTDPLSAINRILKAYNAALRSAAAQSGAMLIDVERACRDVQDRARNYKQSVELASAKGEANPQGQALLARTVQDSLGLLPQAGWRPFR